jgi:ankyrin repeat protein
VSKDELNRREPPLITACRMHFTEGVISLVNAGADIDSQDNFGHTALWVAARQQMPDLEVALSCLIHPCSQCSDMFSLSFPNAALINQKYRNGACTVIMIKLLHLSLEQQQSKISILCAIFF